MTIAVGILGKGGAVLGADQMVTQGSQKYYSSKIYVRPEQGIAFTLAGYLAWVTVVDDALKELGDRQISVSSLSQTLHKKAVERGWEKFETKGGPAAYHVDLMLTDGHCIAELESGTDAGLSRREVVIGSGRDFALGALWASKDKDPKRRALFALKAAVALNPYCGGDLDVMWIRADKKVLIP